MNLKKIIYVCKIIGIYGSYTYECLNSLPSLKDKDKHKPFVSNKDRVKEEPISRVHEVHS